MSIWKPVFTWTKAEAVDDFERWVYKGCDMS